MTSDRGLGPNLASAALSRHLRDVTFVKVELDSGTVFLNDGVGPLTFAGDEYTGVGDFGGVSTIEESVELSPYEINLYLSGLDDDLLDEVMNQNYFLRPVTIYVGSIDIDTGLLGEDPSEIWAGKTDSSTVSIGETNAIVLTVESDFAEFEKVNGSVFSDADLQKDFPGDTFFKFLALMQNVRVVWRGKSVTHFDPNLLPDPGRGPGNTPGTSPFFGDG